MRKLYLVPIIHTSADMGSSASALDQATAAQLGQERWQNHKKAIDSLWDSIERFFAPLDVTGFKVYQDGLVADGEDGLRVVREGRRRGSRNYEIVGRLLEKGASLVRTEDASLIAQERAYITKVVDARSRKEREAAARIYSRLQARLLRERDWFIAGRINETLRDGESGILFIGALHDVASHLPDDIQIVQVLDIDEVRQSHSILSQ